MNLINLSDLFVQDKSDFSSAEEANDDEEGLYSSLTAFLIFHLSI